MDLQLDQNYVRTRTKPEFLALHTHTGTRSGRTAVSMTRRLAPPAQPVLTLSDVAQATGLPREIVANIVQCLRQTGAPYPVRALLQKAQMPDALQIMMKIFAPGASSTTSKPQQGTIAKSNFEITETDEHGLVQLRAFFWHETRKELFAGMNRRGLVKIRVDFWQNGQLWRTTYEFLIARDVKVRVRKVRSKLPSDVSWGEPQDPMEYAFSK